LPDFEMREDPRVPLDKGEFGDQPLTIQEVSRQNMVDAEVELHDYIDSYEGDDLTLDMVRAKAGEVMGARRVSKAYESMKPPSKQPTITNPNMYGIQQSPNELDMEEVRGYNDLPQRQSDASGSLLPQGKQGVNGFVQKMTQEGIDDLEKIVQQMTQEEIDDLKKILNKQ